VSEKAGVVRVTISVPREVKAEMDAVAGTTNWSAIATAAFRVRLLSLASQKEAVSMKDVIARMKAAETQDRNEEYLAGRNAGESWVKEHARPRQLRALSGVLQGSEMTGEMAFVAQIGVLGSMNGFPFQLYVVMNSIQDPDKVETKGIEAFWKEVCGDDPSDRRRSAGFAWGFAERAVELWTEIKDEL
jgi:hypothetical protein